MLCSGRQLHHQTRSKLQSFFIPRDLSLAYLSIATSSLQRRLLSFLSTSTTRLMGSSAIWSLSYTYIRTPEIDVVNLFFRFRYLFIVLARRACLALYRAGTMYAISHVYFYFWKSSLLILSGSVCHMFSCLKFSSTRSFLWLFKASSASNLVNFEASSFLYCLTVPWVSSLLICINIETSCANKSRHHFESGAFIPLLNIHWYLKRFKNREMGNTPHSFMSTISHKRNASAISCLEKCS